VGETNKLRGVLASGLALLLGVPTEGMSVVLPPAALKVRFPTPDDVSTLALAENGDDALGSGDGLVNQLAKSDPDPSGKATQSEIVAAPDQAAPAPASAPVPTVNSRAASQTSRREQPSGMGLRLPPIRTWGSVAYDLRIEDGREQQTTQHLITTTVNAATYVWQPWLAVVSGGLGYTVGRLDERDLETRDDFVTGYARISVFPQSRFPFEARYQVSDSRIDSNLGASSSYKSTQVGVAQRYRPAGAGFSYTLSYDHNTQDSTTTGEDVQDLVGFDMGRDFKNQALSLNANWNRNRRLDTSEQTQYRTLVVQHRYTPSADLSIQTVANLTDTENEFRLSQSQFEFSQLSSYGFWRDPKRPLTVSGGARLYSLAASANGADSETQQASANVGATYLLNKNARVNGNLNVSTTDASARSITNITALVGVGYQGDTRRLGKYDYDWFGAGDVTHATTSGDEAARNGFILGAQVGHSLGRVIDLGGTSKLMLKASQSMSALAGAVSESEDSRQQLQHSASVTWSKSEENTTTLVRLSANDARFINGKREVFQLINLQATRNRELGQYASWAGNLTIQSVRQETEQSGSTFNPGAGFVTTASADLTYVHQRVFGIPRLRFYSQIKINHDETLQLIGGPQDREQMSWENRLHYSVGRLESRLELKFSEFEGERRTLLMWRLIRQFGD